MGTSDVLDAVRFVFCTPREQSPVNSPPMAPQQRKQPDMAQEKQRALHQYRNDHGHFSLVRCVLVRCPPR